MPTLCLCFLHLNNLFQGQTEMSHFTDCVKCKKNISIDILSYTDLLSGTVSLLRVIDKWIYLASMVMITRDWTVTFFLFFSLSFFIFLYLFVLLCDLLFIQCRSYSLWAVIIVLPCKPCHAESMHYSIRGPEQCFRPTPWAL